MRLGVRPFAGSFCLLRGCVAMEYGLVLLGLHCFLAVGACVVLSLKAMPGLYYFLRVTLFMTFLTM